MNLIVLGCGTIIQKGMARNCSGYLLDQKTLIDCGPGIWRALHHHQIGISKIDVILFSHFHVDHTSDFAPFLQERYLTIENRDKPLTLIGPNGLNEWYIKLTNQIGAWPQEMNIRMIELDKRPLKIGVYIIKAIPTLHSDNSICFRIEKNNTTLFYSGDTDYDENIGSHAKGSQLAIMEASNTEETKIKGHLTPGLAGKLAALSEVDQLLLTHMYPEVREMDPAGEAAKYFKGKIIIAEEGMEIEF